MLRLVGILILVPALTFASEVVGTVGSMIGYATVERGGVKYATAVGVPLHAGDVIYTGRTGRMKVLLKDNSVLSIGRKTSLKLESLEIEQERNFNINVLFGRFKMDVAKFFLGKSNGTVSTPTAVAGVRGTVLWGDTEMDAVCALEGKVSLTAKSSGKEQMLTDGMCRGGMGEGALNEIKPTGEQLAGFLAEFDIP